MIKKSLLALTAICILTTTHQAQARTVTTINPLSVGVGTLAAMGAAGASVYSLFNSFAALYYSTFRKEQNSEDRAYNNAECRQHHRTAFLSYLSSLGLGAVAAVAFIPSVKFID